MKKPDSITDEDIDKLFENNDTSVIENISSDKDSNSLFLPEEMDASKNKSIKISDRPKYSPSDEYVEKKKQKEIQEKIKQDIENTNSLDLLEKRSTNSIDIFNVVTETINKIKNEERNRQLEKQRILSGGSKLNFDPSTNCKFHVYEVKDVMGNMLFCSCKYCSAYKEMTMNEWDDYKYKYKKYL